MGLWSILRPKSSIRSELKSGASRELGAQQDLSRIERDYQTNIRMQVAAQTKVLQMEQDEQAGRTYKGAHKIKGKYGAVAADLQQEQQRFGKLLPRVQSKVAAMRAFLRAEEQELTLERFQQGYQEARGNAFDPGALFREGKRHPAGFDELKAIWDRCAEIEGEAALGNLSEASCVSIREAILHLTEAGLGGHIPRSYVSPLEEGTEKTGLDFLLESGRAGLVCGALRNALLAGMYEKLKNQTTSELKVEEFSKLLIEKQVSSAITHRITISAAYRDAVQEYLHPRQPEPEVIEVPEQPEPVKVEVEKQPEPVKVEAEKQPEPEKVEKVKQPEPVKVEVEKQPEPVKAEAPKQKIKKEIKKEEKKELSVEEILDKRKPEIVPVEEWLKGLSLQDMLPTDLKDHKEKYPKLTNALDFYQYVNDKHPMNEWSNEMLKLLSDESRWYCRRIDQRAMALYLEEKHPEILAWIVKESALSCVLKAMISSYYLDVKGKDQYEACKSKVGMLQALTHTVRDALDAEYKKNKKEYEDKAKECENKLEANKQELEEKKKERRRRRPEEIKQVVLHCEEVLKQQDKNSPEAKTMETLLRLAEDFHSDLKPRAIEEYISYFGNMKGKKVACDISLKLKLFQVQSAKYMLKYHPYATRTILRYLELLRFRDEYMRLQKEGKLAFVEISKESLEQINEELQESEKIVKSYEKADWMAKVDEEREKGIKIKEFLIPDAKSQKKSGKAGKQEQKTAEQIADEKQADAYAEKERRTAIQAIKEAYPAAKESDMMVTFRRLGAFLGGGLEEPQERKDYFSLGRLHEKKFTYTPEAMAKMVKIRDLDRFLGIFRTTWAYYIKVRETMENGEPLTIIEDVIAEKPSEFFSDWRLRKDWDPSLYMDRDFATKLCDLQDGDLDLLLGDVLKEEQRKKLSEKLEQIKETLNQGCTELIAKEDYEDESRLEEMIDSYHRTSEVKVKNATVSETTGPSISMEYYKEKKRYPALRGNSSLKIWMQEAGEEKKPSESMEETRKAVQAYYAAVDKNWGSTEYYQVHRRMLEAFRKWKSSEESAGSEAFRKLSKIFTNMYGKAIFQKPADTKKMEKVREACRLQDELNLRYGKYKYQNELKEYAKKGKEEQYKKKYPKPELLDRSGEALFPHMPCAEDIKQGHLGDCFFLSTLLAVVRNDPQEILDRMEDLGDVVKVTFERQTVYVSKKICLPQCAKDSLWVQVMEKAYAMLQEPNDDNTYIGDDYMGFADELLKERGFESLKPEEKDTKLMELFAHTTHHLDSGGNSHKTYRELFKAQSRYTYFRQKEQLRVYEERKKAKKSKTEVAYEELWNLAVNFEENQPEEEKIDRKKLKEVLRKQLEDKLMRELEYRLGTVETLSNRKQRRAGYRALTVDDFRDALRDVKNWKTQMGRPVFYDLLVAVQKIFPEIDEQGLIGYLNQLGEDFMNVGMHTKSEKRFQYGCRMEPDAEIRYTDEALEEYQKIQTFLDGDKKEKVVFAETAQFLTEGTGGGLHDHSVLDGMAMGHAYIVTGYKESHGHKFITMRNPWGTGEVFYAERTRADQSKYLIGKHHFEKERGGGEFDLELNDFMNKIDCVYLMNKEEENKND